MFAVCKCLCFQLSHIATHGVCVFPVGLNDGKPKDYRQVYIIATPHRHKHTHTTQNQYIFVHDAILESVTCGDTQIETFSLRVAMRKLKERSIQGETGFQQQFFVSYTQSRFTIDYMFTTAHVSYVSKLSPCELLCVCSCWRK